MTLQHLSGISADQIGRTLSSGLVCIGFNPESWFDVSEAIYF